MRNVGGILNGVLDTLREFLRRKPFIPFKIKLTNGDAYEVAFPGLVAEGATQLVYCYPHSDRWAVLRMNQLAALEMSKTTKGSRQPRQPKGKK